MFLSDEFATPCSTPDELEIKLPLEVNDGTERKSSLSEFTPQISESVLHDRIYDK